MKASFAVRWVAFFFSIQQGIQATEPLTENIVIPEGEQDLNEVDSHDDSTGTRNSINTEDEIPSRKGQHTKSDPSRSVSQEENLTGGEVNGSNSDFSSSLKGQDPRKPTRIIGWGGHHPAKAKEDTRKEQDGLSVESPDKFQGTDNQTETNQKRSSPQHHTQTAETVRRWGAGPGFRNAGVSHKPNPDLVQESESFLAAESIRNHRDGFNLAARVYIGDDKMSHFDDDEDITLPYYDCNAAGSTTSPLAIQNIYFRHSIAAPTVWNGDPSDPVLVVALRPFRMELDSGESKDFSAGDVVLLEDSLKPGHRMIVSENHEMSLLFITLRTPHRRTGKENLSIKKAVTMNKRACSTDGESVPARVRPEFLWDGRRIRLAVVGTVALSVSAVAADLLAKAAPLWLAVGLGGACFVIGLTMGLTTFVEWAVARLELWRERKRLDPVQSIDHEQFQ